MRKPWILFLAIPLAVILAFVVGRLIYYGAGVSYTPPDRPLTDVELGVAAPSERIDVVDNPTVSRGVVVIDYAHDNALFIEELNTLLSKIVSRGFSYEIVLDPEVVETAEEGELIDKLRYAKALILPLARREYTPEEITEIERFVERGGRVFIIGDPTRTIVVEALNSIAGSFGVIYANDYLYSLDNNDNNYRNVIYTNFTDSSITAGLEDGESEIILYSSSSVRAPGHEIILGDETTFSSTSEGGRETAAAALTVDGQVLAIGDLTFFSEPYSAAENNGILINNIADFLTGGRPTYNITGFPFYFNPDIDIVFDDPLVFNSQFEDAAALKEFLENNERNVEFADEIGETNDVIFVSRFDKDLEAVEDYLSEADIALLDPNEQTEAEEALALAEEEEENASENNEEETEEESKEEEVAAAPAVSGSFITQVSDTPPDETERFIDGRIQVEGVGQLERGGSTLFYLHQDGDRNILIILSDTPDTTADAFDLLLDDELADCQVSPQIAVCQTEDPDETLPPSLRSNRINKILIVSDNDGRRREDAQTGALAYTDAFSASATYDADMWVMSQDGELELDDLLDYDAVIWTTGDYWDDSIGQEDVDLLTEYVGVGGNLLMSGASIAFDWDHTEFLQNVAHVDYLDFAEQTDLELILPDHPIADDFEPGSVISFTDTPSGEELLVDVVTHTPDARVIFSRGPESDKSGAPAVTAYEDDRVKIAYFAFPVYLMPAQSRALLINNTMNWFTKKPLDLPNERDYEPYETDGGASDTDVTDEDGEETPADEDAGDEDTEDTGDEDTGDEDTGDEDTGDEDTGDEDTGDEDTGDEDTGDEDTGDEDTGDEDTGDEDTGDEDTGDNDEGEN